VLGVIPAFRDDGYLPEGVHTCTEPEAIFRFGGGSKRRRRLVVRLRRWLELARKVGAQQLLLDGSFVTAKKDPVDIDAVIFLPADFGRQVGGADAAADELEEMLLTRQPEELFVAEDESDRREWITVFSRTREPDGRRKGVVEILL
jgi:hypothetical protein